MGHIRLLDDLLINKIAAGEVVERPASAVKELVENCLDAGATRINVELQDGGRKQILISDNGKGMDRDDAILALKRHATSKISKDEDLFNLHTMGFRGEALASISAVSRITLITCQQGQTEGVKVVSVGGEGLEILDWSGSPGTTIIVEDLFFNVPVRAKFLKTASTEYGNVLELIQSLALAWPHVSFTLSHNGKEQLSAAAVQANGAQAQVSGDILPRLSEEVLRRRFVQIFKNEATTPMVFAEAKGSYGSMFGLVSAPGIEKATARDIYLFVNGRFVRDKGLRYAVLRGFHSHLLRGKYPIAVIFLTLDPGLVDVNVHPNKTEVRLQFASELQGMIAMAIRECLRKADWSAPISSMGVSVNASHRSEFAPAADSAAFCPDGSTIQGVFSNKSEFSANRSAWSSEKRSAEAANRYKDSTENVAPSRMMRSFFSDEPVAYHGGLSSAAPSVSSTSNSSASSSSAANYFSLDSAQGELQDTTAPGYYSTRPVESSVPLAPIPWTELEFLGSIADCYLLFRHGSRRTGARLLVLDQHAFHERIIYERLCHNVQLLKRSQALLVPEVLTFAPEEIDALKDCQGVMESNGFRISIVGSDTVELLAVPALLAKADAEALLGAFIKRSETVIPLETNVGLGHEILSTMACHAAVRAGEGLGENELKALLSEAQDVDFFHNCPHGRRVFRWWDEGQIGRWFDR
ncbi:MAG: DNA mismatch repair endonuclease MutL [Proteobacteria bacterium]|nr:DNA mismatch repair endonuclease MutL [Pseudomonadota bacterium]